MWRREEKDDACLSLLSGEAGAQFRLGRCPHRTDYVDFAYSTTYNRDFWKLLSRREAENFVEGQTRVFIREQLLQPPG